MGSARRESDPAWLTRLVERLPASPLSVLGVALAVVVLARSALDPDPKQAWQQVVQGAFPFLVSAGVVALDRRLLRRGVDARDRLTVFSFALGGFLAAAVVTALQLLIMGFESGPGVTSGEALFLTLAAGTVGIGAGSVAGTYEIRQRAAAREADRQRERLEEFAGVVSHDLRNPLEVARGHLQATLEEGDPQHLFTVRESLDRMDELIEDSLALARRGRVVDETDPVPLGDVARVAWKTVETPHAALAAEVDRTVEADDARLRELFENLFRNAVEHGGGGVTVTVGALPDGEGFYVADDGPGIPENDREKVLERGHTTAEDGSGLGLSIVSSIAEGHGWGVRVTDGEEGGARFEFRVD